MFHIIPGNFFAPLSSPNRIVYWECICKLFSVMEYQLSFGVERDVLVDELEYYFDQTQAAEMTEEEFAALDSRGKANSMLRKLEFYGWIEIGTDKSYIHRTVRRRSGFFAVGRSVGSEAGDHHRESYHFFSLGRRACHIDISWGIS